MSAIRARDGKSRALLRRPLLLEGGEDEQGEWERKGLWVLGDGRVEFQVRLLCELLERTSRVETKRVGCGGSAKGEVVGEMEPALDLLLYIPVLHPTSSLDTSILDAPATLLHLQFNLQLGQASASSFAALQLRDSYGPRNVTFDAEGAASRSEMTSGLCFHRHHRLGAEDGT